MRNPEFPLWSERMVEAIRQHPDIGIGSCHPWDECLTDDELIQLLDRCGIVSIEAAVALGLAALDVFDDMIATEF